MATEAHISYVCQQCKQPLQLDKSLEELSPSAYDMIAASLPQPPVLPPLSAADKLARVPAPAAVKAAWSSAQRPNAVRSATAPDGGGGYQQSPNNPADSFVLLQDSVMRSPSSAASTPTPKPRPKPSKRQTAAAAQGLVVQPPSGLDSTPQPSSPPAPRTHNLRHLHKLFDLISSKTDIDHPLCSECTHALMDGLNRQLEEARKERDGYIAFEKEAKRDIEKGKAVEEKELAHLEQLKAEENAAIKDLKDAESELDNLNAELASLEAEEAALTAEEAEFWAAHSATQLASSNLRTSLSSLKAAIRTSERELEALERTNVYNDAFCVGTEGVFGTINGLRLGRAGTVVVEWAEINAAWGQTLLLLHTIARKLSFTFETYRLHPMGSFSRVSRVTGETYELYGSSEIVVTRILHSRRFDFAMVAFLDCLRQIMEHILKMDDSVDFLYSVNKDKIGDASIKLLFSQEEQWTKALRYILVVLKKALFWVVSKEPSS